MANTFVNVKTAGQWLVDDTLRLLTNMRQVSSFFKSDYSKEFKGGEAKGDTITIKLPQQFRPRLGSLGYTAQNLNRPTTTVTIDQVWGVDFEWDSFEAALHMERGEEELRKAYTEPAAQTLYSAIEVACATYAAENSPNVVGVLGTDPTTMTTFGAARQRMVELGMTPTGKRGVLISPGVNTAMVDAMKGLMQADDELSRQYKEGTLGRYQGFRFYESMSLKDHTAGTAVTGLTVKGASQSGSSILLNATNGQTLLKGDKISIDNVYYVNPMTKIITQRSVDKQFTVTADVTAASSEMTVSIFPSIKGPLDVYQNVDALPANAAAVTLWPGTSSPSGKQGKLSLAIHEDAFALVSVPLDMPKGSSVEIAAQRRDPDSGISLAFIRQFDGYQRKMINRFDVIGGFGRLHAEAGSIVIAGA